MKNTKTVIVCTAGVGFIVFIAGITLGWFGFPAIIVYAVKQVSTVYKTSNSR
jgi:VIT1/CCC1 family predicted Fe2+/Mn2+ transporter